MPGKRHTPEQIARPLREAEVLLSNGPEDVSLVEVRAADVLPVASDVRRDARGQGPASEGAEAEHRSRATSRS